MKYGRKANLSTKSCSEISELEDNKRNCSERKKLLEMEKVAGNRRSCQKVAKQLVGSPRSLGGGGGRGIKQGVLWRMRKLRICFNTTGLCITF